MMESTLFRLGSHLIAAICGSVAFVCFWASFYVGELALYALLLWGCALAMEYVAGER